MTYSVVFKKNIYIIYAKVLLMTGELHARSDFLAGAHLLRVRTCAPDNHRKRRALSVKE